MKTNKKGTLHCLCGKIASGKSTLSKQLIEEHNAIYEDAEADPIALTNKHIQSILINLHLHPLILLLFPRCITPIHYTIHKKEVK